MGAKLKRFHADFRSPLSRGSVKPDLRRAHNLNSLIGGSGYIAGVAAFFDHLLISLNVHDGMSCCGGQIK